MAEIKIEKRSPKWPWILLALAIIAGILIYLFAFNDEETLEANEEVTEEPIETDHAEIDNSTIVSYVTFIQQDADPMGLDHEYTNEALLKLTNATEALAEEINYDIANDIERVRSLAEKITEDPFETTHANSIKEAAGILAQSLKKMQQQEFPDLANGPDAVINAAMDIETDVLTLNQKTAVKNFFRESADLLQNINHQSQKN
jgi:hypothetical protein